jgi:hypothetical protein
MLLDNNFNLETELATKYTSDHKKLDHKEGK